MTALAEGDRTRTHNMRADEKSTKSVLLIEDNPGDARILREMLAEQTSFSSELTHVTSMSDAERQLAKGPVDIVLLDLGLPDVQGLEAVRRTVAVALTAPLVVLTGLDDEDLADQALQNGAQDYLIKGAIDTRGLVRALRYASERKRLDRLKDEFVSTVSHELRTPLTSISGSLGLLVAKSPEGLSPSAARLLAIAHTNTQRLVRLVDDILDIEKMEAGRAVFIFRHVEVNSLVEHTIEANRGFAERFGVRIRLEDGPSMGEVRADADRLSQVLTNLLSNAIKFSPTANEVVVSLEKRADLVRISVRNHGPGISADFKSKIFDRFAQADSTNTRQKGGTGLGLSIVKQIVNRLGGEVSFADAPGDGTIFHVDLPCWERVASQAVDTVAQSDTLRILLCEDDFDTAVLLREQLKQAGFATDFAYGAVEAIRCAEATQYYAILVDLQLPDGDGISVILRLRELPQYSNIPIIVVSVDPSRGSDDSRSSTLNVLGWLRKPVDIDHLMRALTKSVTK